MLLDCLTCHQRLLRTFLVLYIRIDRLTCLHSVLRTLHRSMTRMAMDFTRRRSSIMPLWKTSSNRSPASTTRCRRALILISHFVNPRTCFCMMIRLLICEVSMHFHPSLMSIVRPNLSHARRPSTSSSSYPTPTATRKFRLTSGKTSSFTRSRRFLSERGN